MTETHPFGTTAKGDSLSEANPFYFKGHTHALLRLHTQPCRADSRPVRGGY